jgi:hypothetical protein
MFPCATVCPGVCGGEEEEERERDRERERERERDSTWVSVRGGTCLPQQDPQRRQEMRRSERDGEKARERQHKKGRGEGGLAGVSYLFFCFLLISVPFYFFASFAPFSMVLCWCYTWVVGGCGKGGGGTTVRVSSSLKSIMYA